MTPEPKFRSTLFNLDQFIAPRLIRIFYGVGLIAITIYTVWGIISATDEGPLRWVLLLPVTLVSALVAFILLRLFCEAALVYFKSKEAVVAQAEKDLDSARSSIFEDVREAFEAIMSDGHEDIASKHVSAKPARKSPTRRAAKKAQTTVKSAAKPRKAAPRKKAAP